MKLELDGSPVSSAVLRIDRRGVPNADLVLVDTPALAEGDRVTLTVGDLEQLGTLKPGGEFGSTSYWTWVAGGGGWDKRVDARAYHDEGGVLLSRVAADLAADAGEFGVTLDVPDRSLGTDWTRRAGYASEALDTLTGGAWYVAADGVTHLGDRPAVALQAPATLTVDPYEPHTRRAVIRTADGAVAALLPGTTLTAEGLPEPLTIGALVVRATPDTLDVEAYGEAGLPELLRRLVGSIVAGFLGLAPMRVAEARADAAGVEPVPGDVRSAALPSSAAVPQAYGVPGVTATLQAGAPVVLSWLGGDPASPTVVLYPPGVVPQAVRLDAVDTVTIGDDANAKRVPTVDEVNVALDVLNARIMELGGVHSNPPTVAGAAKLRVEV